MKERGTEVSARIPYSEDFTISMVQGKTIVEQGDIRMKKKIEAIMETLQFI